MVADLADHHVQTQYDWDLFVRRPDQRLRSAVFEYADYAERINGVLRRRELPSIKTVLIINLGGPLRIEATTDEVVSVPVGGGFFAGVHDRVVFTESIGDQQGVEVRLSPIGAHRLLGLPMDSLVNQVIELDDLLGPWARQLIDRLQHASSPRERLSLLDAAVTGRLAAAPEPAREVLWAWRQLRQSHGDIEIGRLAHELGWSRKRLIARFRETVGVPPKTAAQILRFERSIHLLSEATTVDWSEIALQCGYYDQSHLVRDFRRFAHRTPSKLRQDRIESGLGFGAG